jgi:hypothetical protein
MRNRRNEEAYHSTRPVIPSAVPNDRIRGLCLHAQVNARACVFVNTGSIASGPVVPQTVARRFEKEK